MKYLLEKFLPMPKSNSTKTDNLRMDTQKPTESIVCLRCRRLLRVSDEIRCEAGEVKYHSGRTNEESGDGREAGDSSLQWRCAVCHTAATKPHLDKDNTKYSKDYENLIHAINVISEKFELVNKIQLPKLNNDMLQIKLITERIIKQNQDILRKIEELDSKRRNNEKKHCNCIGTSASHGYRKRNVNFAPNKSKSSKTKSKKDDSDQGPMLPVCEKAARFRTRRRSYYLLNNMFLLLNGKFRKSRTPRRKLQ